MSRAWLSGLMILASAGLLHAVERHVSTEYGTIQAAVDDCNDGDVVIIAPGSYTGDGNRDIQIIDKGVTVRSIAPDNPDVVAATVIDCNGSFESPEPGVYLSDFHIAFRMQVPYEAGQDGQSYDRSQSSIEGLTIINGCAPDGAGIYCENGSPSIRRCIIAHNWAVGHPICVEPHGSIGTPEWYISPGMGSGIFLLRSSAIIEDCVFEENIAYDAVHALECENLTIRRCTIRRNGEAGIRLESSNATVANCLICENEPNATTIYGGGIHVYQSRLNIDNCTITGNYRSAVRLDDYAVADIRNSILWASDLPIERHYTAELTVAYCDVQGLWDGTGNFDADPCFAGTSYWVDANDPNTLVEPYSPNAEFIQGDYHLRSQASRYDPTTQSWIIDQTTSPCIDAGDPMRAIGLEPFPNGGRVNIGVYGSTAEASRTYFGEPICETIIAGDINGDCRIDLADFAILTLHWLTDSTPTP